jgi:hypothetical protein
MQLVRVPSLCFQTQLVPRYVSGAGGVGAAESDRVRVKLRLHVEAIEYDGDGEAIRVKGRAALAPRLLHSLPGGVRLVTRIYGVSSTVP